MTRIDHLLTILVEECCETGQRATKALRFGLGETQDGQEKTNAQRLIGEFLDLQAAFEMLCDEDKEFHEAYFSYPITRALRDKKAQVDKYYQRSREHGRVTE